MSKKLFDDKEMSLLKKNKNVKNVTKRSITYTDEFKRIFIIENFSGDSSRKIFERYGLKIQILGLNRIRSAGNRWRKKYEKYGVLGLEDKRRFNKGRMNFIIYRNKKMINSYKENLIC